MKLRTTRPFLPRLLSGPMAVPIVGLLASSCADGDAGAELSTLSQRVPALASMVEVAREAPPERTESGGIVVRSLRGAEPAPSGWTDAARTISVDVEEDGNLLRVSSRRQPAEIRVRRLGSSADSEDRRGSGSAAIEGAAIVGRDDAGDVRSIMVARPHGVEDLLVRHRAGAVGYEVDLPRGWSMKQPAGFDGLIEIRDGRGRPRFRVLAGVAWDADGARVAVITRIDGRRVTFEVPGDAKPPVVIDPEWQDTSSPAKVRARSTATVLQDGRVLVVGGLSDSDDVLSDTAEVFCTTEIYDPLDLSWEAGPSIPGPAGEGCTPLMDHVAVPLADGSVLVAGGANSEARVGANQPGALARAWRFDPKSRTFTETGAMSAPRVHHTGTLMASGKVLIAGGSDRLTPLYESRAFCPDVGDARCQRCVGQSSADLYDPATGVFTRVEMPTARACHTATLLDDDSVLLVGGGGEPLELGIGQVGDPVATLSRFDGESFTELPTRLSSPRFGHVAIHRPDTNEILVAFGRDESDMIAPPKTGAVIAEVLDVEAVMSDDPPETATPLPCVPAGEDPDGAGGGASEGGATGEGGEAEGGGGGGDDLPTCPVGRSYPSAVLSRTGKALIAGGQEADVGGSKASVVVDAFDFESMRFDSPPPPQLTSPASKPVLTLLPTGKILLVGYTAPAEFFDDTAWHFQADEDLPRMTQARSWHTATPLPDGRILIVGGYAGLGTAGPTASRDTAELFDPATMASTPIAAPMVSRRLAHTATFLPPTSEVGARVLFTGGMTEWKTLQGEADVATETAELYDVDTQTFIPTGSMSIKRAQHVAVRLATGEVLVSGGFGDVKDASSNLVHPPSAELYDPTTGVFTATAPPAIGRCDHTATLLTSGDVLLAGGFTEFGTAQEPTGVIAAAEIFDAETRTFRSIAGLVVPRGFQTATTLPDGQVLFVGGSEISSTAEIFDPETELFRITEGSAISPRQAPAAVMLPTGKVMISGGAPQLRGTVPRGDVEIFDPATEHFESVPGVSVPRWDHEAVLLVDGRVALFGGTVDSSSDDATDTMTVLSAAAITVGAGSDLVSGPHRVAPGGSYDVQGSALSSYWETSSGPYASPTGSPIAVWVPTVGAPMLGTFAPWSEGAATWVPPSTPYAGSGFLFAARHGQSSVGLSVQVERAPLGIPCTADGACESGFCSDGVCCDERCHVAGDDDLACRACSVAMGAAQDGTCSNVAEDTDPHEDCTQAPECAERFAVCGGDGACKECRCASKLDCADGYVCTADGHCERPLDEAADDGCAVATPGSLASGRVAWLVALAALALAASRRRGMTRADDVMNGVDTYTCDDVCSAGGCSPSKRLRAATCVTNDRDRRNSANVEA